MTTATELVITLPLPPNMANGRMHWRTKDKARKAYIAECEYWQFQRGAHHVWRQKTKERTTQQAHLGFTLYVGNRMDDDGALSRAKWPVDWLVSVGYLVDDKRPWCSMSIPEQVITRDKSKQRVEITISYQENQ